MNRLRQLTAQGQSAWLDFTQRSFVASGELRKLIDEYGVTGVTSNPSIFDQAITETSDYDDMISQIASRGCRARQAYEEIAIQDIKAVADELLGVFERTNRDNGFVSLEVAPHFAREVKQTLAQARDFWRRVGRPNLMIKVPGTKEGLACIRRLTAEGINVNVTLLFGIERYKAVADAYMSGLEDRLAHNLPIDHIASVASFFISRIDLFVDSLLDKAAPRSAHPATILALKGQAGIAYGKKAFIQCTELFQSERFKRLRLAGGKSQRILWASTGTKNKNERDVRYVEALLGPGTVTTLSRPTLEAFINHGDTRPKLTTDVAEAEGIIRSLGLLGISLETVAERLEEEGLAKFTRSFDHLLSELERKLASARKLSSGVNSRANQPQPAIPLASSRGPVGTEDAPPA